MLTIGRPDLRLDPYPYVVKDGFVEQDLFDQLSAAFPSDELFKSNKKNEWGGGRINLVRGMPTFMDFIESSPPWRKFYDYMNSEAFVRLVVDLFGEHIVKLGGQLDTSNWAYSDYVEPLWRCGAAKKTAYEYYMQRFKVDSTRDKIFNLFQKDQLYTTFDLASADSGYHIPVHTDNRNKIAIMLLYFSDLGSSEYSGGDLIIHRHRTETDQRRFPRYPGEENTEGVLTLKPKKNLGIISLNCNNSYHSTTPFKTTGETRKFLYVAVAKRHVDNAWACEAVENRTADARGVA